VKYEEVYIKDYANVPEAIGELGKYFGYYNTQRPHQALGYRTPEKVFFGQ
jgi:putative transposase